MDIFQLKYFVSAANIGNFTLAAYENHISQSSFSKQIMNLEDELGVELFVRKKRHIVLTAAGEHCLDYAYKMLSVYDDMVRGMESYSVSHMLPITVAAIPVMLPYALESVIFKVNRIFPDLLFSIHELPESTYVLTALQRGECDFAIMRTDFLNQELYEIYPVVSDRLAAVLSINHPLAAEKEISLKSLENDRMIMPPKDTDLRIIGENACIRAGFRPNIACITSGNMELTLKIVENQGMVYLAFEKVIGYYPRKGFAVVPLKEDIISRTAFVRLKSRVDTRTQKKVAEFLGKEYGAVIEERAKAN
ncbi:MAG TPA: LysR family transcriptional regulator [Candidatus Pelethocola excrementipullorum]|nr:LysR family transcriptional regulator [Candidatus Pelethocola excrementipullorum]